MHDGIRMTGINCVLLFYQLKRSFLVPSTCCPVEEKSSRRKEVTIDYPEAENVHFGTCRFIMFPSLFSGSSGFGGRVGSLDTKLSEQGGAEVSFSISPHPQCLGSEQGK